MKKILFIVLLSFFLVAVTHAQTIDKYKLSLTFTDVITSADSLDERIDTAYSPWQWMGNGRFFNCGVSYVEDTAWIDDSTFYFLQMSFDGTTTPAMLTTISIDTLLVPGAGLSTVVLDADATVLPLFGRLMMIHWDSIGAGEADSALVASASYESTHTLWYSWR